MTFTYSRFALGLLIVGALMVPFFASAQTIDEIRAQIIQLLAKLEQIEAQGGASTSGTTGNTYTGIGADLTQGGLSLSGQLEPGDRGSEVTRLQQHLARDSAVYPDGLVTGYYGSLTTRAVQRFQEQCGIVYSGTPESTGYGRVGSRTLNALRDGCAAGVTVPQQVGALVRVTPVSGNAPLTVTATATVNTTRSCEAATYVINFGDGSPNTFVNVPANHCAEISQNIQHTYTTPGTRTVTLGIGSHQTTVQVTVGASTTNTNPGGSGTLGNRVIADRTSGASPLAVVFDVVINGNSSCDGGTYTLDFGDGARGELPYPADACAPQAYEVRHTYSQAGTFYARLYKGTASQVAGGSAVRAIDAPEVAITTTGNTSAAAFNVNAGIDGNARKIRVTFEKSSSCAAYTLDWGDATTPITVPTSGNSCAQVITTQTHEHTYSGPGSYAVKLTRGSSVSNATVVISAN